MRGIRLVCVRKEEITFITSILLRAFVGTSQFPRMSKELEIGTEKSSCLQLERMTDGLGGCLDVDAIFGAQVEAFSGGKGPA